MRQSQESLKRHWDEQLRFLDTSAAAYDKGDYSEAKRIAATMRLLLQDSKHLISLATQIGLKNTILFWSSSSDYTPSNLPTSSSLLMMKIDSEGVIYEPIMDQVGERTFHLDFEDWWNEVIFDDKKYILTRRDVLLNVADKDGGVHIDPQLPDEYARLAHENSLGWMHMDASGASKPPPGNPAYPAIRQIAFEFQNSLSFARYSNYRREAYPERKFEMRFIDDRKRFLWSPTDRGCSPETQEIIDRFLPKPRKYYIDYFPDGRRREVVTR